jgi:carbamoyl-phosphate synthase large subunit
MIDMWFLDKIKTCSRMSARLEKGKPLTHAQYTRGKKLGYTDEANRRVFAAQSRPLRHEATFKMVDTCAGEFAATTPYFYGTYDTPEQGGENEALEFIGKSGKETVVVWAPARSASARASSSTTPACTAWSL